MKNFLFHSRYTPLPIDDVEQIVTPRDCFKMRFYASGSSNVSSVRAEFENMHKQEITHVANMPANLNEVLTNCQYFGIICLDRRMHKFVSEFCSRSLVAKTQK